MERGSGIYRADARLFECINMKEGTYFQQHHLMLIYFFIFNQCKVHLERCRGLAVHGGGCLPDFLMESGALPLPA